MRSPSLSNEWWDTNTLLPVQFSCIKRLTGFEGTSCAFPSNHLLK